jgi:hypothetical protein
MRRPILKKIRKIQEMEEEITEQSRIKGLRTKSLQERARRMEHGGRATPI